MKKELSGNAKIYKRLLTYLKPHKSLFIVSIFGFLIYSATQPLFAALIKNIINTLQSHSREKMYLLPIWFSGLIVVRSIGAFLGNYFLSKVSCNVVHTLRCEIFDKYTELPTVYFDANNTGHMISRITNNVGQVTNAATDAIR
ncbi:MAG: ABC transporter transmembrane domain-containing protein, partial [Methylococcales bacterium]